MRATCLRLVLGCFYGWVRSPQWLFSAGLVGVLYEMGQVLIHLGEQAMNSWAMGGVVCHKCLLIVN